MGGTRTWVLLPPLSQCPHHPQKTLMSGRLSGMCLLIFYHFLEFILGLISEILDYKLVRGVGMLTYSCLLKFQPQWLSVVTSRESCHQSQATSEDIEDKMLVLYCEPYFLPKGMRSKGKSVWLHVLVLVMVNEGSLCYQILKSIYMLLKLQVLKIPASGAGKMAWR